MKYIILACAIASVDRLTKGYAERKLPPGHKTEIVKDKLSVHNLRNSGAAMGLFNKNPRLLTALTALASLNVLRQFYKIHKAGGLDGGYKFSLACLAGGAVGNLSDRVRRGYVTDIVQVGNGPVFNAADVSVTLGAAVFVVKNMGPPKS